MSGLVTLAVAMLLGVLVIVGDIAAVTLYIPGQHPTVLGYIALYVGLVLCNGYAWGFIGAIALGGLDP